MFWRADSLMGPLNGTFLGEGAQSIPGTIRIILIPNTQMSQFCPVTAPWFHNQFLNFELTRNLSWSWCIFCPFKDCLKSISLDKDCLKTKRLDTQFLMGHLKLHMSKWDRNVPLWIVTYIVLVISLIDTSVYLFAGWFNQFPAIFAPFPQGYRKGLTKNWKKSLKFRAVRREISIFFNFEWALFYTRVETAKKWRETG